MSTIRTDNIQSTDNSVNIPVKELVKASDVDDRVIYVESVAELEALPTPTEGQQAVVYGSGFIYNGASWKPTGATDVRAYGAVGDGVTDDTAAIQQCVNECGSVLFKDGTYMIDATTVPQQVIDRGIPGGSVRGIFIPSDRKLEWNNAKTKAIPNSATNYSIFTSVSEQNIELLNPFIEGDRDEHTGTDGEWGFGVYFRGVENASLKGGKIYNCWGDGVAFGAYSGEGPCKRISMENVEVDRNRRNGLTITSADGFFAKNCLFNNTHGTLPEAGVDIEPDETYQTLKNIVFDNCQAENNNGAGYMIYTGAYSNSDGSSYLKVTFNNCSARGNSDSGYSITNWRDSGSGSVVMKNCTAEDNKTHAYRFSNWNASGPKVVAKDCVSIDPVDYYFSLFNSEGSFPLGNIAVVDMDFIDTGKYTRSTQDFSLYSAGGISDIDIHSIYGSPSTNAALSYLDQINGLYTESDGLYTRSNKIKYIGKDNDQSALQGIDFYSEGRSELSPGTNIELYTGIDINVRSAKVLVVSTRRVGTNLGLFGVYHVATGMEGTGVTSFKTISETNAPGSGITGLSFDVIDGEIVLKISELTQTIYHPSVTAIT